MRLYFHSYLQKLSLKIEKLSLNQAAVSIFSGMDFMYLADWFQDQSNGFYSIGGLGGVLWGLVIVLCIQYVLRFHKG